MSKLVRVMLVMLSVASLGLLAGCGGGQASLEGTKWKLTGWSISAQKADEFATTLEFQKADQLGGKAPVNQYGGSYTAKPDGSLKLGDINRTLMAGPEPAMQAEDRYFSLLGKVERYTVDGNTLTLADKNGNELLVFTKQ